jgi:hypothetical protein
MLTGQHDVLDTSLWFLSCYSTVKLVGALGVSGRVMSRRVESRRVVSRRVESWRRRSRRVESIVTHQDEVKAGCQHHVTRPTDCDYKYTYRKCMHYQCPFVALLWVTLYATSLAPFCWFACLLKDTDKRVGNDTR